MGPITEFGIVLGLIRLLLIVGVTMAAGMIPVHAQEGTPGPVVCDEPARPVSFIVDLNQAPQPEITPTPLSDVPEGDEVTDPAIRADVTAVIEELIACVNQGELLRAVSLYDDHYLRRSIDPEGLMEPDVALELGESFATPEAVDEEETTVLEQILSIRQTPDGAVVVIVEARAGSGESQVDLFALRHVDGKWLIVDGLSDIDFDPAEPTAT